MYKNAFVINGYLILQYWTYLEVYARTRRVLAHYFIKQLLSYHMKYVK